MSSSIQEAIEARQAGAARKARAAATMLAEGDSSDLRAQIEAEDALDSLMRYTAMERELADVAEAYAPYGERSGNSLLRDMVRASGGDRVAESRFAAHRRANPVELRGLGAASTFAATPAWLTEDRAPTAINSAPLLSYARDLPLHAGFSMNLVGFSTPPTAGPQPALNASISNADVVDTTTASPIRTFAGSISASLQLIEQGERGVDAQIIPALVDAANAATDASILNGSGSSGSLLGFRNVSGASAQTYTSGTPTAAELISNIEQTVRKVQVGGGGSEPVVIMHPRRLSFLREKVATATAPIAIDFTEATIPSGTIAINGLNIIADPNMTTTNGAGTNEDVIVVLRDVGMLGNLWVSPPVVFLDLSSKSSTLEVVIIVRRYACFAPSRLPAAIGILSGTGLIAP